MKGPLCSIQDSATTEVSMATLKIKLPDELYDKLKASAKERDRSVAQEAIRILSEALEPASGSILELRGLGKDLWKNISPESHVASERESWD